MIMIMIIIMKYLLKLTINESQVNTDEDPELKELFSVDTFPRVMLWSKRLYKLFSIDKLIFIQLLSY